MRTVRRYLLRACSEQSFPAPYLATALAVRLEDGEPALYMMVDPTSPAAVKVIVMCVPGGEVEENRDIFIGCFERGPYVWSVFERF